MNDAVLVTCEAQAEIMKALGHPIRLFIARELSKGEMCVYKIVEIIGVDTSTISKHLSLLKHAKVVNAEKRGNCVYYSLNMPCVLDFLECSQKFIRDDLKGKLASIKS